MAHNQEALQYLQRDEIGKIIAKGLANLYKNKPERPVKYLAQWLKTFSKNKQQMQKILQSQEIKANNLELYEQANLLQAQSEQDKRKQQKMIEDEIFQFKNMIANHQYQQQLLEEVFPQFVENHTNITGAYIGELNHPPREITDEDVDENAHLNTGADKVINYIGSSLSHKNLMRGKILKLNEGVTANAFSLAQQQPVPATTQEGQQQVPKPVKQKYIYIPNVVKNQQMHYFKIPKLGAYLAVPLVYSSYLTQKIFDEALQAKKQKLAALEEFNKKKQEELDELNKDREQLARKIHDLQQRHSDETQLESLLAEQVQLDTKIKEKEEQNFVQEEPNLSLVKNSYVFCVDNLGKDEQLSKKDIDLITDLVNHFKISWEVKQKQLLHKDIDTQLDLLNTLPSPPQTIKQQLEKAIQVDDQTLKGIQQIQDEKLQAYKTQQAQLNKLKGQIKNNRVYLDNFLKIKEFRVIKFKQVIQNILFFLQQTKKNINIPKKTILNWKDVKSKYITEQTFNNILNYIVQGPKTDSFNFYSKTPLLLEIFQKFNEAQIFSYNVGLGALVKFIKKALKHRISNVELRKAQREQERQQRAALIEQNETIQAEKLKALEAHRNNLSAEEFESFKEEQWIAKYDTEHPKKEVPPEIVQDIDNDI